MNRRTRRITAALSFGLALCGVLYILLAVWVIRPRAIFWYWRDGKIYRYDPRTQASQPVNLSWLDIVTALEGPSSTPAI